MLVVEWLCCVYFLLNFCGVNLLEFWCFLDVWKFVEFDEVLWFEDWVEWVWILEWFEGNVRKERERRLLKSWSEKVVSCCCFDVVGVMNLVIRVGLVEFDVVVGVKWVGYVGIYGSRGWIGGWVVSECLK